MNEMELEQRRCWANTGWLPRMWGCFVGFVSGFFTFIYIYMYIYIYILNIYIYKWNINEYPHLDEMSRLLRA